MQVVVAGRDRIGGPLGVLELISVDKGGFEHGNLAPDGGLVYGALYGSFDDESVRWATGYRLKHMLAGLQRSAPMPGPHSLDASMGGAELERDARKIVEAAIGREPMIERPPWWPPGVPVVAGPVDAHSL
jgi:hypothetical protein